jgi:hypothetical protein
MTAQAERSAPRSCFGSRERVRPSTRIVGEPMNRRRSASSAVATRSRTGSTSRHALRAKAITRALLTWTDFFLKVHYARRHSKAQRPGRWC